MWTSSLTLGLTSRHHTESPARARPQPAAHRRGLVSSRGHALRCGLPLQQRVGGSSVRACVAASDETEPDAQDVWDRAQLLGRCVAPLVLVPTSCLAERTRVHTPGVHWQQPPPPLPPPLAHQSNRRNWVLGLVPPSLVGV
jgi:hypothetical protein